MNNRTFVMACLTPLLVFSLAFLALPLIRLFLASGEGDAGWAVYLDILRKPRRKIFGMFPDLVHKMGF